MKRIIFTGLGLLLATSTAMAHVLDGRWAFNLEACNADYPDSAFTVNVAAGEILYWESSCSFDSVAQVGEFGEIWRAAMSCNGEGETWTTDTIFGVYDAYDGTPVTLVQMDLNLGFVLLAVRCGEAPLTKG